MDEQIATANKISQGKNQDKFPRFMEEYPLVASLIGEGIYSDQGFRKYMTTFGCPPKFNTQDDFFEGQARYLQYVWESNNPGQPSTQVYQDAKKELETKMALFHLSDEVVKTAKKVDDYHKRVNIYRAVKKQKTNQK